MTDWKSQCISFNTYQDDGLRYYNDCKLSTSKKSVKDILDLAQKVGSLKQKTQVAGYVASEEDKVLLKRSMNDFCCAMWAREDLQERHGQAVQDMDVAKRRVEAIQNPPNHLSYFGTVVPFGRPLRPDSVPILLSISIVFLILSLGLLLNLGNIQLGFSGIGGTGPSYFSEVGSYFQETNRTVLILTVLVSMAVGGGIFYAFFRPTPDKTSI